MSELIRLRVTQTGVLKSREGKKKFIHAWTENRSKRFAQHHDLGFFLQPDAQSASEKYFEENGLDSLMWHWLPPKQILRTMFGATSIYLPGSSQGAYQKFDMIDLDLSAFNLVGIYHNERSYMAVRPTAGLAWGDLLLQVTASKPTVRSEEVKKIVCLTVQQLLFM